MASLLPKRSKQTVGVPLCRRQLATIISGCAQGDEAPTHGLSS
jgi:hypothetical protein